MSAVIWVNFAYILTPFVIERAYRGESFAVFNHMITGQDHIPVAQYLARWSRSLSRISCALAVIGFYALLALLGLTRGRKDEQSASVDNVAMSKRRLLVFYVLGAIIFGGSALDVVRDTEHWPFSPYSMDSDLWVSKTFSMMRLYGVVQRFPLLEIPLDRSSYTIPFDNSRLAAGLERAVQMHRQDEAVADCLTRYEAAQVAGQHLGPPLIALRLYRVTWTLDPWVSNVDRPDHRELLSEVTAHRQGSD
jgi:hypothetical protein